MLKNTNTVYTIAVLRRCFLNLDYCFNCANGPQFTSTKFQGFMTMNGIKHIRSSTYHPSSNSGEEIRTNRQEGMKLTNAKLRK